MYGLEFDYSLWKTILIIQKSGSNDGTDHWTVDLDIMEIGCLISRLE